MVEPIFQLVVQPRFWFNPWGCMMGGPRDKNNPIKPKDYVNYFGPTEGYGVRLADTDIVITVEADYSRGPLDAQGNRPSGNEVVFGGGKVTRESMGQGPYHRGIRGTGDYLVPDTVITGALILDYWGIVKADVALRDGKIHAIGKAGNPLIMSDVGAAQDGPAATRDGRSVDNLKGITYTDDRIGDLVVGPGTEIISGNGKILTAGAIDTHVHLLLPGLAEHALSGGITTCIGGGTGMATGSVATTVTPGIWHIQQMMKAMDAFPLNVGLLGKGGITANGSAQEFESQARAGACGYKIHEDWGATPTSLRDTLKAADEWGMQVSLHSDTLNEAGFFQRTKKVIEDSGRSIHSFHTEGAGGGHAPDILRLASLPNVLPASTNPTLPLTKNTTAEGYWMVMLAHHLSNKVDNDRAFAASRVRLHTTLAENVLHDFGALSITSSDALAMGRIGELVMRTWQTAHFMKRYWEDRGDLPGDLPLGDLNMGKDNERARRYVAKYTINPAIAQGIDKHVGSIQAGKYADLVLWDPRFFGLRAEMVLQGGVQVWAVCGSPTAAVTQPQPYWGRENWGNGGKAVTSCTRMFVSQHAGTDSGDGTITPHDAQVLKTDKPWVPVDSTKDKRKEHMKNNNTHPDIQVGGRDACDSSKDGSQSYVVTIDEKPFDPPTPSLLESIPMTQRYSLF
ncbi:MAG TPA: urease subunit alpha [Pseudonocardiaceae bacterium]|nr:urease subunit alpha [Pseudonocardiaceae bacterium]